MEVDKPIDFKKDDLIYKIIIENKDGIITKIIDTNIYKIISVSNEYFGGSFEKYLSRDTAVIIPENQDSIKDFGDVWVIQSVLDGKTRVYAKHVYERI